MPTYRNDTHHTITVGELNDIKPGDTFETYLNFDDSELTKTANTPYLNPTIAEVALTSTGVGDDQEVALNTSTNELEIVNFSLIEVIMFWENTANTPGTIIGKGSATVPYVESFNNINRKASKLIFQFAGVVGANEFYVKQRK